MPPNEAEVVLWVTPRADTPPPEPAAHDPALELKFEYSTPQSLEQNLGELSERVGSPVAVIVDQEVEKPLRVARQVYGLSPLSQILFMVPRQHLAWFRNELSLAPMIGTYWTVVETGEGALDATLPIAVRTSRQRRQLRTSLDAINLRLGGPRPAEDSTEYRKLVISDKYLATILEHAQDAIVSLDLQGRVASWNRGAVELFGYPLKEAVNLRVGDLVAADGREVMNDWFDEALRGSPVLQVEVECSRAGTERFTAEFTLAPVRDETSEVIAVSLIARDITQRKQTEEELRRIQAELEQRVSKRTAALRAVNEELEAFTYSASHDLRAPLRGIDGFSQAILEDYSSVLDSSAIRYVERIRAGAQRMGEIIDALLMLSRITTTRLHLQRVDLGKLAREIVAELQEAEPGRQLELEVQPGLLVKADQQLMRIALQNLLGNAWKFTRERDPARIEVGKVGDGEENTFFIRDNGAGFDMSYADKLFAPFQRIHHPSRFEGSGIGLGTVQRVISRHGGKVWGRGQPDAGATFYFQLPDEQALNKVVESRSLG